MIERGLTQKALAELIKVDEVRVSAWFTGKNNPCWANIIKIAKALDLQVEQILVNYNHLPDMFIDVVLSLVDQVMEQGATDLESIKLVSEILGRHFEKINLNLSFERQLNFEFEKHQQQQKKEMTNQEALDLLS